jgi:hypothetical protein
LVLGEMGAQALLWGLMVPTLSLDQSHHLEVEVVPVGQLAMLSLVVLVVVLEKMVNQVVPVQEQPDRDLLVEMILDTIAVLLPLEVVEEALVVLVQIQQTHQLAEMAELVYLPL